MKNYRQLTPLYGYGWGGQDINQLSDTLRAASIAFGKLKKKLAFDAIAFTGSSGAAIAFYLGVRHKIPLIYVRKEGETAHGHSIEGTTKAGTIKKYLIVDDFVETGSTIHRIIEKIQLRAEQWNAYPAKPVGVFCFGQIAKTGLRKFAGYELMVYAAKDIN